MKYLISFFILISSLFANTNFEIVKNIKYSSHYQNNFDIYLPKENNGKAIFMVHGGAWKYGDKAMSEVVENKVNYWVNKGYIFISANYRLQPFVTITDQVEDVAKAFAYAQEYLKKYNIKPSNLVLMGHSTGAHLVSLLTTKKELQNSFEIKPWLGTISLDTAALNVVAKMQSKHPKLYDNAFGKDYTYWEKVSPFHQLKEKLVPFLAVCSTKRKISCKEAKHFIKKAEAYDTKVELLKIDLRHKQINNNLGLDTKYTSDVNAFIESL